MNTSFDEKTSILLEESVRYKLFDEAIKIVGSQKKLANYLAPKITNRRITRDHIKNWKKGKHKYGWNDMTPLNIILELCKLTNNDFNIINKHALKYNPPWQDPKKIKYLINANQTPKIIEYEGQKYLDASSILPKTTMEALKSKKCLPLFAEIKSDKIKTWSENSWNNSNLIINRYIKLDNTFFQACAIYFSEGTTHTKISYNGCISIGNTESEIINKFIKFINDLLLDCHMRFSVDLNSKNATFDDATIIDFWKTSIKSKLAIKNLKVRRRQNYGSKLQKNYGTFQLTITNAIIRPLIFNLINVAKQMSLENPEYGKEFLKGLLRCEGSIYCKKNSVQTVSIGCCDKENREFIKELLKSLDFTFGDGKFQINICGWDNFYKIHENNLFYLEKDVKSQKSLKFANGFSNHSKTYKHYHKSLDTYAPSLKYPNLLI